MDTPSPPAGDGCSYPTVQRAQRLVSAHAVVAVVGSLACIVTIALIAATRTYRMQIHRLRLYLSVACLLFATSLGFEAIPVDLNKSSEVAISVRQGWNGVCAAIGFLAQYFAYSKSLAIVWVSFYMFTVAIFKVRLNKIRYEVAGALAVFLLPSVITWIPLVDNTYGLTGTWCWIRSTCNTSYPLGTPFQLWVSLAPVTLLHIFSLLFIAPVTFMLCKGALVGRGRQKKQQNFSALKETTPLLVYPTLYSLLVVADTAYTVALEAGSPSGQFDVTEMIFIGLYQLFALALPLSFLLHPSVQKVLACRRCKGHIGDATPLVRPSDSLNTPLVPSVSL